jgi:hypothetical protein
MPYKLASDRAACKRRWRVKNRNRCIASARRYKRLHKTEVKAEHARYREANRLKINRASLVYRLKKEGMTPREIVRALTALDNFNGICQCCGKKCSKKWCVDHCHRTMKFRGIIGHSCNVALGFVRDDLKVLRKLAVYLGKKL